MQKPALLISNLTKNKKLASSVLAGLIGIPVVIGGLSYYAAATRPKMPESPQVKAERDYNAAVKKKQEMIATVKKQVQLPTNEDPVMATVSDRSSLPKEDFFSEAQNGDKILMYPKNKKIFLYRPSTQQVLAQAPLDYKVGQPASGSATVDAEEQPNTVLTTPTILPTLPPKGKILRLQ